MCTFALWFFTRERLPETRVHNHFSSDTFFFSESLKEVLEVSKVSTEEIKSCIYRTYKKRHLGNTLSTPRKVVATRNRNSGSFLSPEQ